MISKGKMNLILLLCLTSIVSIGFSSWSFTENDPISETINGDFEVENIVNSADYIYLDTTKGDNNTGISCFKYTNTGYLDANSIVTDTGYLKVYYKINQKKCAEFFNNFKSIKVNFTLTYTSDTATSLNIFNNHSDKNGDRSLSYSIITSSTYTSTVGSVNNVSYVFDITFTNLITNYSANLADEITLEVTYNFFATTGDYFRNNLYHGLFSNDIKFDVISKVSGVN